MPAYQCKCYFFHGKPTKFHTGSLRRFAPWFWIESSCYALTLSPKLRLGRLSPPIAQDDRLKYYFVIPLKKNRSLKRQMQKEPLNTTHEHSAVLVFYYGCGALFGATKNKVVSLRTDGRIAPANFWGPSPKNSTDARVSWQNIR